MVSPHFEFAHNSAKRLAQHQHRTQRDDHKGDGPDAHRLQLLAVNTAFPGCGSEVKENLTWCHQHGRYENCDFVVISVVAGIKKLCFGMTKGTSPSLTSACME